MRRTKNVPRAIAVGSDGLACLRLVHQDREMEPLEEARDLSGPGLHTVRGDLHDQAHCRHCCKSPTQCDHVWHNFATLATI